MSLVLDRLRAKRRLRDYAKIGNLTAVFSARVTYDRDTKAFLSYLIITIFLALLRLFYCITLPRRFDYDMAEFTALLGGTVVLLSFVTIRLGMYRVTTILRSFSLAILTKIGLLPSVVDIYWTGRWRPLADDLLANLDRMFGSDWTIYVGWVTAHPFLLAPLYFAYQSIWWQPVVVGLLLVGCRQIRRVYLMVTVKGVALFAGSCVTMFFPAYGAYTHFGASPDVLPNLRLGDLGKMKLPLDHLRDGIFSSADAGVALMQFPSFHATEVVVMIWAAWRTPLRWPSVLLNVAMLASAPVFGSHYLVDLLAGAAIGAFAIWMIKGVAARADDRHPLRADRPERARRRASSTDAFPGHVLVS